MGLAVPILRCCTPLSSLYTYEPMQPAVPQVQCRCSGVSSFFRHAPGRLALPRDMRLPIYARREFSKSVWDMRMAGVRGVVNLVLIFADQRSSLAGAAVPLSGLHYRHLQDPPH